MEMEKEIRNAEEKASQTLNGAVENGEEKVQKITKALNIRLPESYTLPVGMRLIAALTLIGGLSIIGSLFTDIIQPEKIDIGFYLTRLVVGLMAVGIAYGIITQQRWSLWLYGVIVVIGFLLNPITVVIPGAAFGYLYYYRDKLRPSRVDKWFAQLMQKAERPQ